MEQPVKTMDLAENMLKEICETGDASQAQEKLYQRLKSQKWLSELLN